MTTYPIDLPTTPAFKTLRYTPRSIVSVSRSPFTGSQQVYVHPGAWWEAEALLPPMGRAAADAWNAALLSLNGAQGTFRLIDPVGKTPRGSVGGTPVISGGPTTGNLITISGWPASQPVLAAGDWLQIAGVPGLYKSVTGATSSGGGVASTTIWPALRGSAANGSAITTASCFGIFRLTADWQMQWDEGQLQMTLSFKCAEVV